MRNRFCEEIIMKKTKKIYDAIEDRIKKEEDKKYENNSQSMFRAGVIQGLQYAKIDVLRIENSKDEIKDVLDFPVKVIREAKKKANRKLNIRITDPAHPLIQESIKSDAEDEEQRLKEEIEQLQW